MNSTNAYEAAFIIELQAVAACVILHRGTEELATVVSCVVYLWSQPGRSQEGVLWVRWPQSEDEVLYYNVTTEMD